MFLPCSFLKSQVRGLSPGEAILLASPSCLSWVLGEEGDTAIEEKGSGHCCGYLGFVVTALPLPTPIPSREPL